jgi:Na+-driven multidrug efflux pump
MIQSSVNSFGDIVVAGNSSAMNIGDLAFIAMNAVHQAMIAFVGQNVGAKQWDRLKKIILIGCLQVSLLGLACSGFIALFGKQLLSLYTPGEEEVIAYGVLRLNYILPLYFACGLMDTLVAAQRGMGTSLIPMLASVLGICGFRLVWLYTIFAQHRTLEVLYLSYPVSWALTAIVQAIFCTMVYRNLIRKEQ